MEKEYNDSFSGATSKKKDYLIGTYKLVHIKTGKFYVGSTNNFYERRIVHVSMLRKKEHHSAKLQELYNEDPHFKFEFFYAGKDIKARELAYLHEQQILDEYADSPLLLNSSFGAKSVILRPEVAELKAKKGRERFQDPDFRRRFKEVMIKAANTPGRRLRTAAASRLVMGTPEARKRQSLVSLRNWNDPTIREKIMAKRRDPEVIAREAEIRKAKNLDPVYRAKVEKANRHPDKILKIQQTLIESGKTKKVSIHGIVYDSLREASRILNIDRGVLFRRCSNSNEKYKDYQFIN